jgi:gamma-glutamylcyclotransferase (GGCT)/AIG2-like uncharacterized protein YtfP
MEGADFVREAMVRGRLYVVDWYPGLVLDGKSGWVIGELWRVSDAKLADLDKFEGLPSGSDEGDEYRRIKFELEEWRTAATGLEDEWAWLWEWKGDVDGRELVFSGDWLNQVPMEGGKMAWTLGGCLIVPSLPIGTLVLVSVVSRFVPLDVGRAAAWTGLGVLCALSGILGFYCARKADGLSEKLMFLRFLLYVSSFIGGLLAAVFFLTVVSR